MDKFSIIILAAGEDRRFSGSQPRYVQMIGNETVIGRSTRILEQKFPTSETIVVLGWEHQKIQRELSDSTTVVINNKFDSRHEGYSLRLGLYASNNKKVLVIHGDTVFESNIFDNGLGRKSLLYVDTGTTLKRDGVGVAYDENVSHMSFAYDNKWGQIALLARKELGLIKDVMKDSVTDHQCCFEIFNQVITVGGSFLPITTHNQIYEIDTKRDLRKATAICKT